MKFDLFRIFILRMKPFLTTILILLAMSAFPQSKKTIYCFPGQGSDHRLFDSLTVDPGYELKVIEYGTPKKGATMRSFAQELAANIDTTKDFILLGVSLGGMICMELSEILKPEKTIIISSAKSREELPFRYKFQKAIPVYKLFPGRVMLAGAKMLQPIVEPDRNKNKETFKSMLGSKNSLYMKRTVSLIINWDRKEIPANVYHIHGDNDHTLPLRKIKKTDFVVDDGSHMMTLTRAQEVSELLNALLAK